MLIFPLRFAKVCGTTVESFVANVLVFNCMKNLIIVDHQLLFVLTLCVVMHPSTLYLIMFVAVCVVLRQYY